MVSELHLKSYIASFLGSHSHHAHHKNFNVGHRPFRLFNVWCQDQDLRNLVTTTWEASCPWAGSLWGKLELIKFKVSKWQWHKYHSSKSQLITCEKELSRLLNSQPPSNEEDLNEYMIQRSELMASLAHMRSIEDSCWLQKSRIR